MEINKLAPIEYNNQRILTSTQLAEFYGTNTDRISENFKRNQDRYIKGKHFYKLEGSEKQTFLNHTQIADGSKNANAFYLWTEYGAFLHAKSLKTDNAWEVYEKLVDSYFTKKDFQKLTTNEKFLQLAQNAVALEREVKEVQAQTASNTAELKEIKTQLEKTNFILPETTEAFDEFFSTPTILYTVTEIGKAFGIGAQAVNRYLHKQGVIHPEKRGWKLDTQYTDCNYVHQKTSNFKMRNGKKEEHLMTWWTATGKDFLCTVLSKAGLKQKRQVHPYNKNAKKTRNKHESRQPSLFIVEDGSVVND